jgi:predicted dehydrogenase
MSQKKAGSEGKSMSRRTFMGGAMAAAGTAFTIIPGNVLGGPGRQAPSDTVNVAGVGIGGMGGWNVMAAAQAGANITALCDVDDQYAGHVFAQYPKAAKYQDFREMLEKQKDIDAVMIATPDHSHATIAMAAVQSGKHVYVQKPMTRTVFEARRLTEAAREAKVATQMGNQGHSGDGMRMICEWIWDGAIGPVREVHAWTNRPVWPQQIYRPRESAPVPQTLNWDLWLGPAPYRPYHPSYLPANWRGWWDFGCGAMGDMGCHVLDPVFSALKLGAPTSVEACSPNIYVAWDLMTSTMDETPPAASIIRFQFPARGKMPAVLLTWFDGGMMPPRPEELEPGRQMGNGASGVIFIGDKGKLMCGEYGDSPRLIPESRMREYKQPPAKLPRIPNGSEGHEADWLRACKGGEPASSNFEYAGPMTETVLLGNIALRMGRKLYWDGATMKVTNEPEANRFIQTPYREGWTL